MEEKAEGEGNKKGKRDLLVLVIVLIISSVGLFILLWQLGAFKSASCAGGECTGFGRVRPIEWSSPKQGSLQVVFMNTVGSTVYMNVTPASSGGKATTSNYIVANGSKVTVNLENVTKKIDNLTLSICHPVLSTFDVTLNVTYCNTITRLIHTDKGRIYRRCGEDEYRKQFEIARRDHSHCEIFDGIKRDWCYWYISRFGRLPSLCDEIHNQTWKDSCQHRVAERECERGCKGISRNKTQADLCYSEYAHTLRNPSICEKIQDQREKINCYSNVARNTE